MAEPQQPPIPAGPLNPEKLQAYLNSCPPGLTKLHLSAMKYNPITSLEGVQFPHGLRELHLGSNGLTSLRGVRFPPNLRELYLDGNEINSLEGVQFPHELTTLILSHNQITSLSGVQLQNIGLRELNLSNNRIASLQGVQFPPSLRDLHLVQNQITSLEGVQFPLGLISLDLSHNAITSLQGVHFPPGLIRLYFYDNQIASLEGIQFPSTLDYLYLAKNRITTLKGVQFPRGVAHFNCQDNPLTSLAGMINPNEIIKNYFMTYYNSLYLRDIEGEKAARQSQKAEFARMNELTQQSMHNQLKAITSFLREGMEARARQHEEQLQKDNERGRHVFFVRGPTRKTYPIPFDPTMTIQAVLDYLNTNYYISALEDCGGIQLSFSAHKLEPERKLADYNVQTESTLNMFYKFKPNLFQGGSKKRTKKSKQQRNKSTKKRT